MKLLVVGFVIFTLTSCLENEKNLPSLNEFEKSAQIMLGTSEKFLNEKNATQLHKVAVSLQLSRVATCEDVKNECTLYREFINQVIDNTRDDQLDDDEKKKLSLQRYKLVQAIRSTKQFLKKNQK